MSMLHRSVSSRFVLGRLVLYSFSALLLTACSNTADLPVSAGIGPDPVLPEPESSFLPTVDVPKAVGWGEIGKPTAAPGTQVVAFARNLDHPRSLYVLPNGDVLVAETAAPPKPEAYDGIKGWIMKLMMRRAGAESTSANRITLLRDTTGDGVADLRTTLIDDLYSPYGMALVGHTLYIANTDALVRVPFSVGQTKIDARPEKIMDLPAGPINQHWTKNLIASPDGKKLYVAVGSNSNIAEHGMKKEEGRAAIWEVDLVNKSHRIFAEGLRNPVGMAWVDDALWVAVNERDELGSDLAPDYMTSVEAGEFFGWPYSYYGENVDERVEPQRPDLVNQAVKPDYALGPHTASLGLAFSDNSDLSKFEKGMFVGQHGSWNRDPPSGYKVIFIPFENGAPAGDAQDVLTGFLAGDKAYGRPVDVAVDKEGALLVADDAGNTVWRVSGDS